MLSRQERDGPLEQTHELPPAEIAKPAIDARPVRPAAEIRGRAVVRLEHAGARHCRPPGDAELSGNDARDWHDEIGDDEIGRIAPPEIQEFVAYVAQQREILLQLPEEAKRIAADLGRRFRDLADLVPSARQ